MTQNEEDKTIHVFACAALGDAIEGTFYTDMTDAFPTMSLEGMQAYFIAYDYDTNAMIPKPISDLKDESIIKAFEEVFEELKEKGHKPTFSVTCL